MAKKNVMLCFRVTEEEKERIQFVVGRAQERNGLAVRTDVIKDLIGLTTLGLVNEQDRELLRAQALFHVSTKMTATATVTRPGQTQQSLSDVKRVTQAEVEGMDANLPDETPAQRKRREQERQDQQDQPQKGRQRA